jgi:hypothetical protein
VKTVIPLVAVLLAAAAATAQPVRPGTYNYNDPVYRTVYPPTEVYPGGYVSSYAFSNPGDRVPTTYVTHYRSTPPVVVPVMYYEERYHLPRPVVTYTESYSYRGYYSRPPVASPRGRWR